MSMMDISKLRSTICPIAERYGVKSITLFGSRARGDNRPDSDYDFLISKGKVDNLWLQIAFTDELENALMAHVDVVTDTSSNVALISNARQEGILLYKKKG